MGIKAINGVPFRNPYGPERQVMRQRELFGPPRMLTIPARTHEPVRTPPNTEGLFPYQAEGATWLRSRQHALLADEPGVGKTAQALRAIPTGMGAVVICPAGLRLVWREECAKWRKDIEAVVPKVGAFQAPRPGQLVIMSYDSLPDPPRFAKSWLVQDPSLANAVLILDEAHAVKNYKALRTKKVTLLSRQMACTWALTGTPILGKPSELWGVLSAGNMAFEAFGTWQNFLNLFGATRNRWGGLEFAEPDPEDQTLRQCLAKVMLRRTRAQVLPDLPAKRYQTIPCEPPEHLMGTLDKLEEEWQQAGTDELPPFEMLSSVRAELAQARIPAMLEQVAIHEEEGTPLIVFSDHVEPVHAFAEREGWGMITGDTPVELRRSLVDLFQTGMLRGLALTIGAGGTGLTLTRANTMLFCDLNWTPALNEQAEDRIARIGQTSKKILIKRLVADHPVDRRVLEILDQKGSMIRAVLG